MSTTAKMNSGGSKCMPKRLEGIKEDNELNWLPAAAAGACPQPQTPTESMEFLARSWSLSATELSKALTPHGSDDSTSTNKHVQKSTLPFLGDCQPQVGSSKEHQTQPLLTSISPPTSPRGSDHARKELFLLHQVLNPEIIYSQHLLKNGQLYKNIIKGKTMSRWIKDQKERKKHEIRTQNAQLHAAVSVAGVAAVVASLTALLVTSPEKSKNQENKSSKMSAALASAAALVASHCIDIAEDMGADHEQILSVISSAINVRTNGDIMTLTAGAATALRGAATLRVRMQKSYATAKVGLTDQEQIENKAEVPNILQAMDFVSQGGELLKRTRKGDLHWKVVSVNINFNGQVVAKLKSKHMAGTFTKKNKCIISGLYPDIPAWSGGWDKEEEEIDDHNNKAYFGIQSADRIIEFECRNKAEKQMWIQGIEQMLHFRANMA